MRDKIRVLHVLTLNSFGGIQTLVLQLANEYNNGDTVQCSLFSIQEVNLPKSSLPENIEIMEAVEGSMYKKALNFIKVAKNYDIIHFHGPLTVFQVAALFIRKKIVYTEHGTLQKANINNSFRHLIQKKIIGLYFIKKRANAVILISKWLEKDLNLKRKNIFLISNGLQYKIPEITKNDDVVVTIAARMVPKKRVDIAIDVMEVLGDKNNIKLHILGNGPDMEKLKKKTSSLLDKSVFFLDYRPDAYDLIASSDFYLMTTKKEPFGLVVLEAMMNETMVLALNDSGGPVEILGDKFPELICNTEAEIADKILKFSSDSTLYNSICKGLKDEYKEKYTMQVMAKNYRNVYLKVLES
ncbi:glycosyltransferase family 4 protein [Xanthomarina spongicola]|uniref:Glycosyltransferase involved in cell wall biosynthesis n=1 Tax=Xanthomarina spongicola TaxID=570520 RepID=A0A316DK10_9FLAO|nr:glycosyltransferase family 4 protein [Xanthomarina spongicola]PWK18006.1 glycosyltransferase involved in cell wall biosynthesis [Xanthomarina spongicola]